MSASKPTPVARKEKAGKTSGDAPMIRKSMRVSEIVALVPESEPLLAEYGLSCFSCSANAYETLEEGCASHGFADEDINDLTADLNILLSQRPERPQTLMLTKDAAVQLREILIGQGTLEKGLTVGLDENGGFCMESSDMPHDAKTFTNREVPDMRIHATTLTLKRIGGATIDFREGRFKLDLPEDAAKKSCACKDGGECACDGKGSCGCGDHASATASDTSC